MKSTSDKPKRILAVASGGGHWIQLLRLKPAFENHTVSFLTTSAGNRETVRDFKCFIVREASRWDKFGLLVM